VPYLKLAAVADDAAGSLSLFALNRHLAEAMEVAITARQFGRLAAAEAEELSDSDLMAVNTRDAPERVKPKPFTAISVDGERIRMTLAPASWTVVRLAPGP
jgi:alpha-N-arabinofuranosidase